MPHAVKRWADFLWFAWPVPGAAVLIALAAWGLSEEWRISFVAVFSLGLLVQVLMNARSGDDLPWWIWPLLPFWFVGSTLVLAQLTLVGLASIPYFFLYPDRHAHEWDGYGTPRQRASLARWRRRYARLSLRQRCGRAVKLWWRARK